MPVIELDMLIAFANKADKLHEIVSKIFDKIVDGTLKNKRIEENQTGRSGLNFSPPLKGDHKPPILINVDHASHSFFSVLTRLF